MITQSETCENPPAVILRVSYSLGMPSELKLNTCDEELNLVVERQKRAEAYVGAVGALAVWSITKERFERLSAAADEARIAVHEAIEKLDRHIAEHG